MNKRCYNNKRRQEMTTTEYAGVVELADTYDSGSYAVTSMQVQVLSPAPNKRHSFECLFSFLAKNCASRYNKEKWKQRVRR